MYIKLLPFKESGSEIQGFLAPDSVSQLTQSILLVVLYYKTKSYVQFITYPAPIFFSNYTLLLLLPL